MRLLELVAHGDLLIRQQRRPRHEVLDEVAVAEIGRDASGRGVRVCQQAHLLECGQLVPHGRGRDAEAVPANERRRGDRLRARDVLADDRAQELTLPFSELRELISWVFPWFLTISTLPSRVLTSLRQSDWTVNTFRAGAAVSIPQQTLEPSLARLALVLPIMSANRALEAPAVFSEFKGFLLKTNALALAIAFILGVALAAVVNSLVADIIMPPVGLALRRCRLPEPVHRSLGQALRDARRRQGSAARQRSTTACSS